jgi:hypothetical protein
MALDPSEVEVRFPDRGWVELDKYKHSQLGVLRVSDFRRAKPRRSRVQEMMDKVSTDDSIAWCSYRNGLTEGIRAVCEYVAKAPFASSGITWDTLAAAIEREFLEPR